MDKMISTKDVAELLNVRPITVRRKVQSGEIPSIKIGNRLRFDKRQVKKWVLDNSNRRSAQFLVVDDEPTVGDLIKKALKLGRYQVTTTSSSLDALEIIKQKHFDLIFLDLLMADLDGSELFKHIREADKKVPVVILTGYPDSAVMEKAMGYGPFTVIKKPFTINDVLIAVRRLTIG
ncbi:response regulator [Chloroflexota bacterium]